MVILIGLCVLIGYFIGLISCLLQVFRMEESENKKIKEILDENTR